MKSLVILVTFCAFFGLIKASAIPMWEFLSKQEKTSFLYSMFANQVEEFCNTAKIANCNHELLKYGLNKLKNMDEGEMDSMDPYQRGAHNIIWNSMMSGHSMLKNTPLPQKTDTTTFKPNSYDDQSFGDFIPEESARIETLVYKVPPPKGFVFKIENNKPLYNFNPYSGQYLENRQKFVSTNFPLSYSEAPLTGPMVFKVYPDGTPVRDTKRRLPQDEDLIQYRLSQIKVPDFV